MTCEECQREAPTRDVHFVGVASLLFWFSAMTSGSPLCKSCVHKNFWHLSFLTATTGWLCPVAALLVPFVLVSNVYKYVIACLTLKPVPPQAEPPTLTSE